MKVYLHFVITIFGNTCRSRINTFSLCLPPISTSPSPLLDLPPPPQGILPRLLPDVHRGAAGHRQRAGVWDAPQRREGLQGERGPETSQHHAHRPAKGQHEYHGVSPEVHFVTFTIHVNLRHRNQYVTCADLARCQDSSSRCTVQ